MGTINSALLAILSNPAKGVFTLVGERINAHNAPTRYANPKIVFANVSSVPTNHIKGSSGYDQAIIQIEAWGDTLPQAEAVAEAVRVLIDGYPTDGSEHLHDAVAISSITRIRNVDDFSIPVDGTQQGGFRLSRDYRISYRLPIPTFT